VELGPGRPAPARLCYADTSYSTVPAYKSASLWYRMEAFDDAEGATMALAVARPTRGIAVAPQGWLLHQPERPDRGALSQVKLSFERPRRETGGRFETTSPSG